MDSYIYDGEYYDNLPVYGVDGVSRYAVEVWEDVEPRNPRLDDDHIWEWAFVPTTKGYYVPSEWAAHNDPYCLGYGGYDGVLLAMHHNGRAKPGICVPLCGSCDSYSTEIHLGTWKDVAEGNDRCLVVAYVSWSKVEKEWATLTGRQQLFAAAMQRLEEEVDEMRHYLNDACYGYNVIDLFGVEDFTSNTGYYDERTLYSDSVADCTAAEAVWEEEYYE